GGHAQVGAPEFDTGLNGRRHEDAKTDQQNRQDEGAAAASEREKKQPRGSDCGEACGEGRSLESKGGHCHIITGQPINWVPPFNNFLIPEAYSGSFNGRREPRKRPGISPKMIITTWIVYILTRKGAGYPFPPKTSSDIEVVESEALSVVQHWLKKTEEEASQDIKEKMSTNDPPTHGQDIHVTRDVVIASLCSHPRGSEGKGKKGDVLQRSLSGMSLSALAYPPTMESFLHVKHHLSKSDLLANQSQEVLEERTRIQFIRWSHTRIFQVPSEVREEVMRDRIEQVRRSLCHLSDESFQELQDRNYFSEC
ncbi:Spermatogenesis-associated protein 19, mitochondrial, partial [Galemys pyrenaicus]